MFLPDYSSMNCAVRLMSCSHTFLVYVRILRRSDEKNMSSCRVRLSDPALGPRIFIGVCIIAAFICGTRFQMQARQNYISIRFSLATLFVIANFLFLGHSWCFFFGAHEWSIFWGFSADSAPSFMN